MKSLWGQPAWNQIKSIQLELAEILLDKIPFLGKGKGSSAGTSLLRDKFC